MKQAHLPLLTGHNHNQVRFDSHQKNQRAWNKQYSWNPLHWNTTVMSAVCIWCCIYTITFPITYIQILFEWSCMHPFKPFSFFTGPIFCRCQQCPWLVSEYYVLNHLGWTLIRPWSLFPFCVLWQIRWTKTAGSVSDRFQDSSVFNETLHITKIMRTQGGRYYCKAENGLGSPAIKSIRVDVYCKCDDDVPSCYRVCCFLVPTIKGSYPWHSGQTWPLKKRFLRDARICFLYVTHEKGF